MSAALSAGLVLVATAVLVVGLLVDDGLALVGLSLATSVAAATVLLYGEFFRQFYSSMLTLYTGQYALFGDPRVMPVKVLWDYTYYWGVLCPLFFQRRLFLCHCCQCA